jgi:glycosyltransferase involved in cell wall biosynthesis
MRKPIRVLHIITTLEHGGAENMLFKLVSKTAYNACFQQMVISLTGKGFWGPLIEDYGITVKNAGLQRRCLDIYKVVKLIVEARNFQPHILQTWLYHADILGTAIAPFIKDIELIWNIRCSNMNLGNYAWTTKLIFHILKKLSSVPSVVCANSIAGIYVHKQKGFRPRRWVWIPNGFDIEMFKPLSKRNSFKEALRIPLCSDVIGMVARYDPMKDFDTFFQAARIMLKMKNDVHFILIGKNLDFKNKDISRLIKKHQLAGHVHLLGQRNDLNKIYPEMDLFTLTSSFGEGFPNVIGEAMSCGVPCVATDVGDSKMIIGGTGIVVPARDPNELANAWNQLLNTAEDEKMQIGIAARQRILDEFRLEMVQEQYLSLYKSLLSSKNQ